MKTPHQALDYLFLNAVRDADKQADILNAYNILRARLREFERPCFGGDSDVSAGGMAVYGGES